MLSVELSCPFLGVWLLPCLPAGRFLHWPALLLWLWCLGVWPCAAGSGCLARLFAHHAHWAAPRLKPLQVRWRARWQGCCGSCSPHGPRRQQHLQQQQASQQQRLHTQPTMQKWLKPAGGQRRQQAAKALLLPPQQQAQRHRLQQPARRRLQKARQHRRLAAMPCSKTSRRQQRLLGRQQRATKRRARLLPLLLPLQTLALPWQPRCRRR